MIAWWWLIPAFYTGLAFGIYLIALLQANGRDAREDEQQAAWLAAQEQGNPRWNQGWGDAE